MIPKETMISDLSARVRVEPDEDYFFEADFIGTFQEGDGAWFVGIKRALAQRVEAGDASALDECYQLVATEGGVRIYDVEADELWLVGQGTKRISSRRLYEKPTAEAAAAVGTLP
jgi:hypothetical protein